MTTRSDVKVDFLQDPRVAQVDQPSTAFNMQDVVDTLRKQEDGFTTGLAFKKLINASGKEDLGGGVFVGITVSLQNLKIAFEARRTPAESGTVTTGSGTPIQGILGPTYDFIDTAADFVAANIQPGSLIINFSDRSIIDVVLIDGTDTLVTKVLVNGTANTFQVGDIYQVFNIIQCDLDGGNLVAVDGLDAAISAILPTAFTQIVRTSSSSATLQEQADIQYASFGGGVTVDVLTSNTGIIFPVGTPREPVNNLSDANSILLSRGFDTYFIKGDITVSSGTHPNLFRGQAISLTTITLNAAALLTGARFENATITGTLDGDANLSNCNIQTLNFFNGVINSCVLSGTITLGGGISALILDCFSDTGGCVVDLGGAGQGLDLQNFSGDVTLLNKTGGDDVVVGLASGEITIDNTVTTGTIMLQGVGKWSNKDTYIGGATVVDELLSSDNIIQTLDDNTYDGKAFSEIIPDLLSMANGKIIEGPTGTFKFYEQDNVTVRFTLVKAGSVRSRT